MIDSISYTRTPEQFLAEFEPKMEKFISQFRTRTCSINQLAINCGFDSYQDYLRQRRMYCDLNLIA